MKVKILRSPEMPFLPVSACGCVPYSEPNPMVATKNPGALTLSARAVMLVGLAAMAAGGSVREAWGQAPAAAASASGASSQRGTVKAIAGSSLTLTTDAGKEVAVTVGTATKVLQIAPGSTDLKTAQAIALTDIAVGDRVLVTGKAAEGAEGVSASRVILMKSTDIAERKAGQQADWQKRGSGGIVSAVDAATGTLTVTNGARKTEVKTTGTTIFRRYAGDSVRFEDAVAGTLAQVQAGDQVRVRGAKSEDGTSVQAEEIVSGTFRNLAGTVSAVDAGAGTVTVKDLATKKTVVVKVTANSEFRKLPPEMAARLAMRARGGAGAPGTGAAGTGAAAGAGGQPGGGSAMASGGRPGGMGGDGAAVGRGPGGGGAGGPGGGGGYGGPGGPGMGARGGGGADLSQMISRLPEGTLAELKTGDAVMIVASQAQPSAQSVTAITMLSGVEPILAATPTGTPTMTLSPWNVGGGAPESGGGQ